MTFGKMIPDSRTFLFFFLLFVSFESSAELSLDVLMHEFSRLNTANVRFSEIKRVNILKSPVTLEGTLSYRAPDYLKKETDSPNHSLFEINEDKLYIETETGKRTLSLDSHPLVRAFAESYRATLSGNGKILKQHFITEITGTIDKWSLRMIPKDDKARAQIEEILLSGSGNNIHSVKTSEVSGDTSLMTIVPENE